MIFIVVKAQKKTKKLLKSRPKLWVIFRKKKFDTLRDLLTSYFLKHNKLRRIVINMEKKKQRKKNGQSRQNIV